MLQRRDEMFILLSDHGSSAEIPSSSSSASIEALGGGWCVCVAAARQVQAIQRLTHAIRHRTGQTEPDGQNEDGRQGWRQGEPTRIYQGRG
ncbi:unnamed protein product [Arctogadus glacialis]